MRSGKTLFVLVLALVCVAAIYGWQLLNQEATNESNGDEEARIRRSVQSQNPNMTPEEIEEQVENEFVYGRTKTANDFFKKMKSDKRFFAGGGELSKKETNKVKKVLLDQYAFRSIRERMNFQGDADPKADITEGTYRPRFSQFDKQQHDLIVFSDRAEALAMLHTQEVDNFINRPGQGFGRMPRVSPYDLPIQGNWANRINTVPVGSTLLGEPVLDVERYSLKNMVEGSGKLTKSGMPTKQLTHDFHKTVSKSFAPVRSQGLIKNLDEVAGFQPHQVRLDAEWNGSIRLDKHSFNSTTNPPFTKRKTDWKVNQLQLVSLLLHDEERVYETENLPNMEELGGADISTRQLTDFEAKALAQLKAGKKVVTQASPNRMLMLGAIRAEASCTQCHVEKKGELLGAFSYEILRNPKVEWFRRGL